MDFPELQADDKWIGTAAAKFRYFLGPDDLAAVPAADVKFLPGFGLRHGSRWYRERACLHQAISKYGRDKLVQKHTARHKREQQNKPKREEHAAPAAQRLPEESMNAPKKPTASAAERKQIEKLRASLLLQCRKKLGHLTWRSSVAEWCIECPNVTAAQVAALIGRAEDPTVPCAYIILLLLLLSPFENALLHSTTTYRGSSRTEPA